MLLLLLVARQRATAAHTNSEQNSHDWRPTSDELATLTRDYLEPYAHGNPFPHVAFDGLFPSSFLGAVASEIPEAAGPNGCVANVSRCRVRKGTDGRALETFKGALQDEMSMGARTRDLFAYLKSSVFVSFLETLTGIRNLIPDPGFTGSGVHVTAPGGLLQVQTARCDACSRVHAHTATHIERPELPATPRLRISCAEFDVLRVHWSAALS